MIGQTIGQYSIEELIGRGGQGEVYLARDTRLEDRLVAIKAQKHQHAKSSTQRQRFRREAKLASKVAHPYVATVLDFIEKDDQTFLVMEYVQGSLLSDLIRSDELDSDARVQICIELCQAVQAVHEQGCIHRDIKPSNVRVTPDGHPKLLDFGLAKTTVPDAGPSVTHDETVSVTNADVADETDLTRKGALIGTMAYMSPEQIRGERLTRQSDVFSLGIVAFETLSGEHPFKRGSEGQTMSAILSEDPVDNSDSSTIASSPELKFIMDRALAKAAPRRYTSAAQLGGDLETFKRGELSEVLRWKAIKRRIRFAAAAAILIVAFGGVAGFAYSFLSTPPDWNKPRVAIAFAPLSDQSGTEEGAATANLVSRLSSIELASSRLMRPVSPDELAPHLKHLGQAASSAERAEKLARTIAFDYLVDGTLHREGSRYFASVQLVPKSGGEAVNSFRVSATSPSALADELSNQLRRQLPGIPLLTAWRDDQVRVDAITSRSVEAQIHYEAARRAMREGRLNDAVESYNSAVQADPDFCLAFLELATAFESAGNARRAREAIVEARRLAPSGNQPAEYRLRILANALYERMHARPNAESELLSELVALFPDDASILLGYAWNLTRRGDRQSAESILRRVAEISPLSPEWRIRLARTVENQTEALGLTAEAARLHALIENHQGLGVTAFARGDLHFGYGQLEKARAAYEEAAAQFQEAGIPIRAAQSRMMSAEIGIQQYDFARASALLDDAEELARGAGSLAVLAEIEASRGAAAFMQGNNPVAKSHLREAIDLARLLENDRTLLEPLQTLASLEVYSGNLDQALRLAAQAIEVAERLGEDQRVAQLTLADAHYQSGDITDSIDTYETILRSESDSPHLVTAWSHLGLAEIFEHQNAYGASLQHAEKARDQLHALGISTYGLYGVLRTARVKAALGQFEDAAAHLDEVVLAMSDQPNDDIETRLALAQALLHVKQGQPRRALRIASRALSNPSAQIPVLRAHLLTVSCVAERLSEGPTARSTCAAATTVDGAPRVETTIARVAELESIKTFSDAEIAEIESLSAEADAMNLSLTSARALSVAATFARDEEQRQRLHDLIRERIAAFEETCGLPNCRNALETEDLVHFAKAIEK